MFGGARTNRTAPLAAAATLALLAGCGTGRTALAEPPAAPAAQAGAPAQTATASATPGQVTGELTVLAAASLTEVFTKLGEAFQAANPGVKVTFSFGASSALAQQILAKAPADVFAAASPATMKLVTDAGGAAGAPAVFVKNQLQIATPPNNPGAIAGLADFVRPELRIVLCAVAVPCGAAAEKVFTAAALAASIDSYEQDVKSVLTKITSGEADAGLVYRTDVKAAGGAVLGIEFAESAAAINDYPVAVLAEAKNPTAAAAWVAFLAGPAARAAFEEAGFQLP